MTEQDDFGYFHGYVGACLAGAEAERRLPAVDADGDWVINWQGSPVYVTAVRGDTWTVRVWANAAHGLQPRAALLRELNQMGAGLPLSTVLLHPWGAVSVSVQMVASAVNTDSLGRAVTAVGCDAEHVGVLLATVHGGHGAFAASAEADAESA